MTSRLSALGNCPMDWYVRDRRANDLPPKRQVQVGGRERLVKFEIAFDDLGGVKEPQTKRVAAVVFVEPGPRRPGHVYSAGVTDERRAHLSDLDILHDDASVWLHQAERNLGVVVSVSVRCVLILFRTCAFCQRV